MFVAEYAGQYPKDVGANEGDGEHSFFKKLHLQESLISERLLVRTVGDKKNAIP